MMEFKGKTAVVTGAAQGIGAAIAHALAQEGAHIALIDNNPSALEQTAANLQRIGATAHPFPTDVSQSAEVQCSIAHIERVFEGIDILVNVAGILRMGHITHMTDSDWQATFAVNVNGVFYMSRSVANHMIDKGTGGNIITVGSNAASVPRIGMAAYAASKAASAHFTRCLALELAPHGIRCNTVSPGSTDTDMQRQLCQTPNDQHTILTGSLDTYRLGIPLGRIASPHDIAHAVCFLASERARHITMHDLRVDGGATLGAN